MNIIAVLIILDKIHLVNKLSINNQNRIKIPCIKTVKSQKNNWD